MHPWTLSRAHAGFKFIVRHHKPLQLRKTVLFARCQFSSEPPSDISEALLRWRKQNQQAAAPVAAAPREPPNKKDGTKELAEDADLDAVKAWEESGYYDYMDQQRRNGW
eukprot:CAMPEP_0172620868 /NCGR_PEP_ID=MMETSP1068-20121228/106957_1 /TAXON_ID=35684 /ORGANISM="Pseudopedinella elastica, Strain CCMP716" /LENGTH=108 /DNA_ID=CAMNT_0013428323 /DNA_START=143 /DNA_END=466 /DNA_ORIENTATION=+